MRTICVDLTNVLNDCKVHGVGRENPIADVYAAAHLYYEEELTQERIARRVGVSRPTVSFPSNEEPTA